MVRVQLEPLAKIGQGFFLGASLAGDIHVQALRNEPVALTPDSGGKWTFHIMIFPHASPNHYAIGCRALASLGGPIGVVSGMRTCPQPRNRDLCTSDA